jgi:hypothetical protein
MNYTSQILLGLVLFCTVAAQAQLAVTVTPPKVAGQKAVLQLAMKNSFPSAIESARAVCFLLDDQGKMVGQSAKWVIGGTKDKPGLQSGATNTFNFVITSPEPLTSSNLTAKIQFNRVILEGGKLMDATRDVTIVNK